MITDFGTVGINLEGLIVMSYNTGPYQEFTLDTTRYPTLPATLTTMKGNN